MDIGSVVRDFQQSVAAQTRLVADGAHRTNHQRSRKEFQRISTPVTGNGYDRPEGITSQSRYTLFRPSDCPNDPDHLMMPIAYGRPVPCDNAENFAFFGRYGDR